MIILFKKEIIFEGQKCIVYKQNKNLIYFNKDKKHYTKDIEIVFKKNIVKAVNDKLQEEILFELDHNPKYPNEILEDFTDFVSEKRNYFFVYQNDSFKYEYKGGYIWSPIDDVPDHMRLLDLKQGNIILHSVNRKIFALSVVDGVVEECVYPNYDNFYEDITQKPQNFIFYNFCNCPHKQSCEDYECVTKQYRLSHFCKKGRKIKVKYFKLNTPIESKKLEKAIREYGQGFGYPFGPPSANENIHPRYNQIDDTWGKQGYLFNLRSELFWAYRKESSYNNDYIFDDVYYYADKFKRNKETIKTFDDKKEVVKLSSIVSIVFLDKEGTDLDVFDVTGDKDIAKEKNIHFIRPDKMLMKNLLGKEIGDVFYSSMKNGKIRMIKIVDIKN